MAEPYTLQLLSDLEGSIEVGWVGKRVFLAQFYGALSENLGGQYVAYLRPLVAEGARMQYFADASRLTQYDLVARSAFFRLVLDHRRAFASMTMLTWAEGVSPMARAFAALVGEPVEILSDPLAFEGRLLRIAPEARYRLVASRRQAQPPRRPGTKSDQK